MIARSLIPTVKNKDLESPSHSDNGHQLIQSLQTKMSDSPLRQHHDDTDISSLKSTDLGEEDDFDYSDPDDWGGDATGFEGASDNEEFDEQAQDVLGFTNADLQAQTMLLRSMIPGVLDRPTPATYFVHNIQNFFRTAQCVNHFRIFIAKIENGKSSVRFIPFVQRVEVGFPVYLAKLRRIHSVTSISDALNRKTNRYEPIKLRFEYTKMDLMSRTRPGAPVQCLVSHAMICNVSPIDTENLFQGSTPNPTDDTLEMHIARINPNYLKRQSSGKMTRIKSAFATIGGRNLSSTSVESLVGSGPENNFTAHINSSVITSPSNKPFDVLIDSEVYGPVTSVSISELSDSSGSRVTLPIATVLPTIF